MMRHAASLGYRQVASRRIYFQDASTGIPFKTASYKRDKKLFDRYGYSVDPVIAPTEETLGRIAELYRMLYIEKYSMWNPQFTSKLLARLIEREFLHCYVLVGTEGRIDGVIGYLIQNGIMTTPLLGYDVSVAQEVGLYRMLSAVLLEHGRDRGLLQNASAGAANFKRARGGEGENEYSLVFTRHLPAGRKAVWNLVRLLANRIALPLVIRNRL